MTIKPEEARRTTGVKMAMLSRGMTGDSFYLGKRERKGGVSDYMVLR